MSMVNQESPCSSSIIQRLERYLLIARWGVILAAAAISRFEGFPGGSLVPIAPLWSVFLVVNLVLSIYIWQEEPLFHKRTALLLIVDAIQTTLIILLTGGYRSAFYVFTLLFSAEIGMVFRWRRGTLLATSAAVWFSVINVLGQMNELEAYAAYIIVSKFAIFLVVGLLVSALNELIYREETACRKVNMTAERMKALNALFFRLGESHFDVKRTLTTVIESTRFLPQVRFASALLPTGREGVWEIVASNLESHPVGEQLKLSAWQPKTDTMICEGAECPPELMVWTAELPQTHLAALRLLATAEDELGYLLVGYQAGELLDEAAVSYLQSLAQETNLALRNAQLYSQEKVQIEQMQRFESLQATFFSAISHELKTPLSVLKMLMPSLAQFSIQSSDVQADILDTITHNLNRLETLIHDLLESTRLEAGAVQLHPRVFRLRLRIRGVFANVNPLAKAKKQQLQLDMESQNLQVWADPTRTDQILSNLLHNAIKFSPPQSHIQVDVVSREENVQICVSDEGPGIPESEKSQIFDKFYVLKEQKALSGVGLGLFICRELVRLYGGGIWVENRHSGGSRFCFTLPYNSEGSPNGKSR